MDGSGPGGVRRAAGAGGEGGDVNAEAGPSRLGLGVAGAAIDLTDLSDGEEGARVVSSSDQGKGRSGAGGKRNGSSRNDDGSETRSSQSQSKGHGPPPPLPLSPNGGYKSYPYPNPNHNINGDGQHPSSSMSLPPPPPQGSDVDAAPTAGAGEDDFTITGGYTAPPTSSTPWRTPPVASAMGTGPDPFASFVGSGQSGAVTGARVGGGGVEGGSTAGFTQQPNSYLNIPTSSYSSQSPNNFHMGAPSSSSTFGGGITPQFDMSNVPLGRLAGGSAYIPTSGGYTPSTPNDFTPTASGSANNGSSASSAIDLTKMSIPSPPKTANPKQPICIGAIMSRALMLYPAAAAIAGTAPAPGSREHWDIIQYRNAEMIKLRLKLRRAGAAVRPDEPHTASLHDVIQVLTPGPAGSYVGDLDASLADVLMPLLDRGLCRLEGFGVRMQPSVHMFDIKVNVLIFTLRSNVEFIRDTLVSRNLFCFDPVPPYDPSRHTDRPLYENAHGGHDKALEMLMANQRQMGGYRPYAQEKVKQVEVQRNQVEEVFKNLANGTELEQSDPGPWIKTELFPHQRKALTFLLQGEHDWSSLKKARKDADKLLKRKKKSDSANDEASTPAGDSEKGKGEDQGKDGETSKEERTDSKERAKVEESSRSLWEGEKDEKGRVRIWKNKITGDKMKGKKGEGPKESKGAILADDMGLGKTLSVVSLIAATRQAAISWSRKPLEPISKSSSDDESATGDRLRASAMSTKVFGQPSDSEDDDDVSGKGKKRRREPKAADTKKAERTRRSFIVKRSKATLLVCPMSTISNWEDQIKEHWNGKVEVYGGQNAVAGKPEKKAKAGKKNGARDGDDEDEEVDEWDVIRVYIYHGNNRRNDLAFLADFDVVITSYSTLANEYSKQMAAFGGEEEDMSTPGGDVTGTNSGDESVILNGDSSLNPRATKPEVDAEIKANELSDALRRKATKGKKKAVGGGPEQLSPLQGVDWFRVVLDEAHYIKSASTVACKASCYLEADRRIALTGTPIQNKIEDVWALFKFLRLSPVDEREVFNKYIAAPCKIGDTLGVARLQLVMRTCTLRRTKDSKTEDGRKILSLPPRSEKQVWLTLRDDERNEYDSLLEQVKGQVQELKARNQLTQNYATFLQHLLRLRQTCDHVELAKVGAIEEDYDGTIMDYEVAVQGIERHGLNQARAVSIIAFFKDSETARCAECTYNFGPQFPSLALAGMEEVVKDEVEKKGKKQIIKPILTKCLHILCPICFKKCVYPQYPKSLKGISRQCGVCSGTLRLETDILEVNPPDGENGSVPDDPPKRAARKKWVRAPGEQPILSTKMQFLHDELVRFSKRNPNSPNYDPFGLALDDDGDIEELDNDGNPLITKSIVFSQWTTMLDRIGDMLDEANIGYSRLDGTMSREDRSKAIDDLRYKKRVEVMLVSTRAGGVGLNLTAACRAYLIDPYWNPSVESQAIDRIHRMGQSRPVTAIKLMITNSVEEKMDQIQQKKASLAQLSLKHMTRKELMEQKAEELASLFS